jgi:superfamily I DNA and RNA helicase
MLPPRDFLYAKSKYGQQRGFAGICRELLSVIEQQSITPLFDAVLVDEAQDLPASFFQLLYHYTKEPKRLIWAYDELQNLSETATAPPDELFGKSADGKPRIQLSNISGQPPQDVILPVCYRNTPCALTLAHALGFGIYRDGGLIQHFDEPGLWEEVGYDRINGSLNLGSPVTLCRRPDASPSYFRELLV